MHLDDDKVDLASHVRLSAVSIKSHVPSDVLSKRTRHAATVSLQWPSVIRKNHCISELMSYGTFAPITLFGPFFVQLNLNRMNRRYSGRQLILVQKTVVHEVPRRSMQSVQITGLLSLLQTSSDRRESCQRFVLRFPTSKVISRLKNVAVLKGLEELACQITRQPVESADKEKDSEVSDKNGLYLCRCPHR